jgi:hypothetical protein
VRQQATTMNYLARRLLETNGAAPALQPAAPGSK